MLPHSLPVTLGVLGLGLAGFAVSANAASESLRCGVASHTSNGMTTLEGVLQSDHAINGSYTFALQSRSGGGSNSVSQGGQFAAQPGTPTQLGQVSINSNARTSIGFTVTVEGKSFDCSGPWSART